MISAYCVEIFVNGEGYGGYVPKDYGKYWTYKLQIYN